MKALSIRQPYASLIAEGKKTIETRTWKTNYRGDILVCASKRKDEQAIYFFDNNIHVRKELSLEGKLSDRPTGVALCIAELYETRLMEKNDERAALCDFYFAYSWLLRNIRLIEPFAIRGGLSLFGVPDELIKVIK